MLSTKMITNIFYRYPIPPAVTIYLLYTHPGTGFDRPQIQGGNET